MKKFQTPSKCSWSDYGEALRTDVIVVVVTLIEISVVLNVLVSVTRSVVGTREIVVVGTKLIAVVGTSYEFVSRMTHERASGWAAEGSEALLCSISRVALERSGQKKCRNKVVDVTTKVHLLIWPLLCRSARVSRDHP